MEIGRLFGEAPDASRRVRFSVNNTAVGNEGGLLEIKYDQ